MKKSKMETSWYEKYHIAMKEWVTIQDIMKLTSTGQPSAMALREDAIEYCVMNEIDLPTKQVPAEVVLKLMDKDLDYFYRKMVRELEAVEMYNRAYGKGMDDSVSA